MNRINTFLSRLSKPVDLTTGTPWKVILKYSLPIIISYLLQEIYILTDAIICGQVLSAGEVAGVNDTFPLTFIFIQFAFGCTAGFSVITGKYAGQNDAHGVRKSLVTQTILTVAVSAVLTVLSIALLPWLLGLINLTPESGEVYRAAYSYCYVIFLGTAAQMGYNMICGVLRAYGDSVTPLIFLVISTVLNIVIDIVFLVPLHMGPSGAALATVIAQLISFIACMAYTFIKYRELCPKKEDFAPDMQSVFNHLRQGIPLGLQYSVLAIGIIVMQGAVVKYDISPDGAMIAGAPAQNGFGAANKLINFLMAPFSGLGSAMIGYTSQNLGKGDRKRIRRGAIQSIIIMLIIFAACFAVGMLLSINGAYQYIFMSPEKISADTIRYGNTLLYVDLILYAGVGFLIVVRSTVQGMCLPLWVLAAGTSELAARVLICTFLPGIINGAPVNSSASTLSFAAVCFGDPGAWILASLVLLIPLFKHVLRKTD